MFAKFWNQFGEPEEKKAFDKAIKIAHTICLNKKGEEKHQAINDLQKILLQPIIDWHLRAVCLDEDEEFPNYLDFFTAFGFNRKTLEDFGATYYYDSQDTVLKLGKSTLFAFPGNDMNLLNSLGSVGSEDRRLGSFKQTENQKLAWVTPLNLGFVQGAGSAINICALNANGEIVPSEIYDISNCLKSISYDGAHWRDQQGAALGKPLLPEFG